MFDSLCPCGMEPTRLLFLGKDVLLAKSWSSLTTESQIQKNTEREFGGNRKVDVILSREANTVGSRLKNCATTALAPVRILGAYIRQGFAVMRNKGGRISMSSFCTVSKIVINWHSVQFNSVAQLCPTLCDLIDGSISGLPVHHQLPEFTQTYVH